MCQQSICSKHLLGTDLCTGFHGSELESSNRVSELATGIGEEDVETQRALKENTEFPLMVTVLYQKTIPPRRYCNVLCTGKASPNPTSRCTVRQERFGTFAMKMSQFLAVRSADP